MKSSLFAFILLLAAQAFSQSNPVPLRSDITVKRIMTVHDFAIRISKDPVSGSFYYNTSNGNIYKIIVPVTGPAHDTLMYTAAKHGVEAPQDFVFRDSILYVLGNNTPGDPLTTGILRKGVLQKNGTRKWSTVMLTESHPTCGYFDHKFSGMVISPAGDSITINSGSRGDHGEIQTRNGQYPGLRNVPLTAKLFRIPAHDSTFLKNDETWLAASGFLFARGTRNNFSMAYDAKGNLFGLENSGDRDHNEEMNWLRRGRHYGFPYRMGDTYNPQQFPSYDCTLDQMINHYSAAWKKGAFYNDPTFPPAGNITFETPIRNIGPDCDKFRDTVTAKVLDASDLGTSIGTFTAHRSPLGLVFDNDSALSLEYRGDAFMLSWTKGCDSTGGYATAGDTAIGPFVDPSQDLTHLHLIYNASGDRYTISATRIVAAFANPVDAEIDSNIIYVLEWNFQGTAGLYKVTLPKSPAGVKEQSQLTGISCFPNPAGSIATVSFKAMNNKAVSLQVFDSHLSEQARFTKEISGNEEGQFLIPVETFSNGIYFYKLTSGNEQYWGKLVVIK